MYGNGTVIRNLSAFKTEQRRKSDFLLLSKQGSLTGKLTDAYSGKVKTKF